MGRLQKRHINFALSGGLALTTLGIFRFTKDIDLMAPEECKGDIEKIMIELGYEKQDFSNDEILSFWSPLKVFGQIDFLIARRKYARAMLTRARKIPIFDGTLEVNTLLPEDLIGLKIQALANDPEHRTLVDAPDIKRILQLHKDTLDMNLVREYFQLFNKEVLLDEWLAKIEG
ncbi:MAG: nucleotidyltransferase [Deltaproteobacteria bacterium]|nr:nucleotidyltransferase [Deltaproteobacteria bacterium]